MNYSRQESHNRDIVAFKVSLLHIYIAAEPPALSMMGVLKGNSQMDKNHM
jgi:hypothetical protein